MTMFTQGLNYLRDLHADDIVNGQHGTSGTAVTVSQTDLQSATAATNLAVTKNTASQSLQTRHRVNTATATSTTFREYCNRSTSNSDGAYDRNVFPGFEHTENDEFVTVKSYFYTQR